MEKGFGIKKVQISDGTIIGHLSRNKKRWVKESSAYEKFFAELGGAERELELIRKVSAHEGYEYQLTARTTPY